MNRLAVNFLMLCATSLVGVETPPATRQTIAVCPIVPRGAAAIDRNALMAMEDQLQGELASCAGLEILERSRIGSVLAEQSLQDSGEVDRATMVRLGQLLRADVIVVGSCRTSGNGVLVNLRAVRVVGGEVAWAGEAEGTAAEVVAQAAALGTGCGAALGAAPGSRDSAQGSLLALKHHERAAGLRGQHLDDDAVAEELLALRVDPELAGGAVALAEAFAAAGCPQLAVAEARAALAMSPQAAEKAAFERLARLSSPPAIAATALPPSARVTAIHAIIDRLGALPESQTKHRDLLAAWLACGIENARDNRDRSALDALREAAARRCAIRREQPHYDFEDQGEVGSIEWSFLAPGPRFEEALAALRAKARYPGDWSLSSDLVAATVAALAAKVMPGDLQLPPAACVTELPLRDLTVLPLENRPTLYHLDLSALPADAVVLAAVLGGGAGISPYITVSPLAQRWVHGEADAFHARAGVAWMAGAFDGHRGPPTFPPLLLDQSIAWMKAHPGADYGFYYLGIAMAHPGESGLSVRVSYATTAVARDAQKPYFQALQDALLLRLAGDRAAAERALRAACTTPAAQIAVEPLIALCAAAP